MKNKLVLKKRKILNYAKKYIIKNGWNEKLFDLITKNGKFKIQEIIIFFPNGYLSLLDFYFEELNIKMTLSSKKLNLKKMKIHKRIRELILLRLKIISNEKDLIKRTYSILLLPMHAKIASILLYKIVDQIWFLSGDRSTDFNFYSKRAILASIYSSTILYWINEDDFEATTKFLDAQLNKVSKIPKIKNKIKNLSAFLPQTFNIIKTFISTKQ